MSFFRAYQATAVFSIQKAAFFFALQVIEASMVGMRLKRAKAGEGASKAWVKGGKGALDVEGAFMPIVPGNLLFALSQAQSELFDAE